MVLLFAFALAVVTQSVAYAAARVKWGADACDALSVASVPVVCAGALVYRGLFYSRQVAVTVLVVAWGARLSFHLWRRAAAQPLTQNPPGWERRDVLARVLWSSAVALPAVALNLAIDYGAHPGLLHQPEDAPLLACSAAAVALAHWSDREKWVYHRARATDEAASSSTSVCVRGPWAWSRHPNYFAELAFHASIYGLAARHVPAVAVVGVVVTLYACLLSSGGVAGLEARRHRTCYTHADYRAYRQRTSPLLPLPPSLYARVPFGLKRLFLFEWSLFESEQFDESVAEGAV
jgi:steroid 5-alpha reductase family enzyme